ncbi:uncharacterized protein LOC124437343 [Xenia sp. Carnegie-2017]|uniref:uncharacterized protein LOC124437343 n=1 Tax=Xenia sp. Carnegie-2017 TaxID=2897299 RepID=UPI001F04AC90|nr:uncharacterized protein LOC124437343 [Xenia sp. Carnegie-2017]
MGTIPRGFSYIKTVPFFLKIAAFAVLLTGLITLGKFMDEVNRKSTFEFWGNKGRLDFGMFAIVVSWIVVMVMVAVFVSGLHEKVTIINWPLTVFINLVLWGIILFIAGCVIADAARRYDNDEKRLGTSKTWTFCDVLKSTKHDVGCGLLAGASVTCFVAAVIFAVDGFFNFKLIRDKTPPPAVAT